MLTLGLRVLLAGSPPAGSSLPLTPAEDVPLPGHASRFDYQWVDPVNRRLYIAHLGDSSLVARKLGEIEHRAYYLSADGRLMPMSKTEPAPDLHYFREGAKVGGVPVGH